MNKYLKELLLILLGLIPIIYLASIWQNLPETVPTHFDFQGNINGWSNKSELITIIVTMNIGMYLLMLIMPKIDPKKRLEQMGDKYFSLRLLLGIFFAALTVYILYTAMEKKINPNLLIAMIGALFAMLGNYMQALKPNYFIGIKTPWTLESEEIWRKTHRMGGRLWMAGGISTILIALITNSNLVLGISFGIIIAIISIIPVLFSYIEFKKISK